MSDKENSAVYEVFAIRYATREGRRANNFIGGDPHDGPMPMDYFIWVARNADRCVVIDAGFTEVVGRSRGRVPLRAPVEALGQLGIDPAQVQDLIITHMHYDHAGDLAPFTSARFHIQEAEMHFVAGRQMRHEELAKHFEVEDVVRMIRLNFAGRVDMYRGSARIAPGVHIHPVGGHSPGLQFVSVNTARGRVVIASDAAHYYENLEKRRPFSTAYHVGDMLDAFTILEEVADSVDHIVPGHDPEVMKRYPAPAPSLEGICVRLDVAPNTRATTS